MTENKRYYVDKDGDLYDGKTNELLMLDFGYDKYAYVKNVLDKLNEQDNEIQRLKTMNNELIKVIQGISKDNAETIIKLWTGDKE